MKLLDRLEALGRKDVLRLVHFHLGSQITDIQYIKAGLEEIARYYVELRKHGVRAEPRGRGRRAGGGLRRLPLHPAGQHELLDAGVRQRRGVHLGTVCRAEGVPMPHLISESGRAITAHHSLLLINVTDVESQIEPVPPAARATMPTRCWSR